MTNDALRETPSAWPRRIVICAIAAVALGVSIYLALYQWRAIGSVWDPIFGDGSRRVLDSAVSTRIRAMVGLPDAFLGAVAYFAEIVLALAGSNRRWREHPWLVAIFGLDVIPLALGSLTLVLLQAFVIRAFCTLCLVSAICSWIVALLAHREVWASLRSLRHRG